MHGSWFGKLNLLILYVLTIQVPLPTDDPTDSSYPGAASLPGSENADALVASLTPQVRTVRLLMQIQLRHWSGKILLLDWKTLPVASPVCLTRHT